MLNRVYLSQECCDKLEISYSGQRQAVRLDPAQALLLRSDWDGQHRKTFQAFIHHDRAMMLEPVIITLPGMGDTHDRGWYTVMNPPQTRVFVTTDIDTELLREQRDVLVKVCDDLHKKDGKLVSGIIIMLDHMLDSAELSR